MSLVFVFHQLDGLRPASGAAGGSAGGAARWRADAAAVTAGEDGVAALAAAARSRHVECAHAGRGEREDELATDLMNLMIFNV